MRRVRIGDAEQWFEMRMASLKEAPSAFSASFEEEQAEGIEFFRQRIASGGDENLIFGAFSNANLVGSVNGTSRHAYWRSVF